MKNLFTLIQVINLILFTHTNSKGQECYVDPRNLIPRGAASYSGDCLNGMAEGYGSITFSDGNKISGKFIKNVLQEGIVEYVAVNDGNLYIGPYKNEKLNGRFERIDKLKTGVTTANFDDGYYVGNSDNYFNLPEPEIISKATFPIFNKTTDPNSPFKSDFNFLCSVPKSDLALFLNKNNKSIGLYDNRNNQIIREFGDKTNPIKSFLCFDVDYNSVYVRQMKNNLEGIYKINISNGTSEYISNLKDQKILDSSLLEYKWNNLGEIQGFEHGIIKYGAINHQSNLIYTLVNNGEFKLGNVKSSFLVSKLNGEKINEIKFDGVLIRTFAINEISNQLYISFSSNDLEYISLFKLDNFEFVKTIFSGEKNKGFSYIREMTISPMGTYLAFSSHGETQGTIIYKQNQFYFGVPRKAITFSKLENILISGTNDGYNLYAYDLENRKILWESTNKFYFLPTIEPILVDNDIILISSKLGGNLAKSEIYKAKFELPDFSQTFFSLNEEVQDQLKRIVEIEKAKKFETAQNSNIQSEKPKENIKPKEESYFSNFYEAFVLDFFLNGGLEKAFEKKINESNNKIYGSNNSNSSFLDKQPKNINSSSNSKTTCPKCSVSWTIMDYDEYSKKFSNSRKETKYGFVPCNLCQGTKKMSVTSGSSYIGKGCISCKGTGWNRCTFSSH
jgi:hypothetical protein